MDNRYIVALEIGSSKIKGLVAAAGALGDINIIAAEEIRVNDCVRYGKIQNVQEVSTHVNDIIRKLENKPGIAPRKISDIFVAIGGRTLSTVTAQAQAKFPQAVEITAETVERLKREASFGLVTDKKTLDILPHAFYIDNSEVKNVVGTVGTHIHAEFSAIVISPANQRNLDLIKFDGRNITRHDVVRPAALADLVLSSSEKQLGCALVDFGAETTTITIYKDDVLQTIITLPIGSRNITRDLMSGLSMTEERAELAKAETGATASPADIRTNADIEVSNYINARAGEIVANIIHQIDAAGFKPQTLPVGIILTGGGARLRNFNRLVEAQAKMPVRMATIEGSLQFKSDNLDRNANIDILAIVKNAAAASNVNCLEPLPDNQTERDYTNFDRNNATHHSSRTTYVPDDDSILEDDDDDVDKTGNARVSVRNSKQNTVDYDDFEEEPEDNGEDTKTGRIFTFHKLREKFCTFISKPIPEEDDIDDLVN